MRLNQLCIGLLCAVAVGSATAGEKSPGSNQVQQKQLQRGPVTDSASFINSLRAAGAGAQAAGEVEQPFFSVTGQMVKVHGEDVQVFQFANPAAADAEAAPISPDGMGVGTSKIHWIGSPHFYKKEKLLVLYVGDNQKVLKTLEAQLGRQFAGK